jgi:hypothetical protein
MDDLEIMPCDDGTPPPYSSQHQDGAQAEDDIQSHDGNLFVHALQHNC